MTSKNAKSEVAPRSTAVALRQSSEVRIAAMKEWCPLLDNIQGDATTVALNRLKAITSPGIPPEERAGWTSSLVAWTISLYEIIDTDTGEVISVPSLILIPPDGDCCRLTGETAITSFASILRNGGEELLRAGMKVRVVRRNSQTVGRSYWLVVVD